MQSPAAEAGSRGGSTPPSSRLSNLTVELRSPARRLAFPPHAPLLAQAKSLPEKSGFRVFDATRAVDLIQDELRRQLSAFVAGDVDEQARMAVGGLLRHTTCPSARSEHRNVTSGRHRRLLSGIESRRLLSPGDGRRVPWGGR